MMAVMAQTISMNYYHLTYARSLQRQWREHSLVCVCVCVVSQLHPQTDHPVPRSEIGLQSKTPFQAQKSVHHILCVIYVTLMCVKWIITESS